MLHLYGRAPRDERVNFHISSSIGDHSYSSYSNNNNNLFHDRKRTHKAVMSISNNEVRVTIALRTAKSDPHPAEYKRRQPGRLTPSGVNCLKGRDTDIPTISYNPIREL